MRGWNGRECDGLMERIKPSAPPCPPPMKTRKRPSAQSHVCPPNKASGAIAMPQIPAGDQEVLTRDWKRTSFDTLASDTTL